MGRYPGRLGRSHPRRIKISFSTASMGGWRKAGAVAPPRAPVVNPRLVRLLARGLLSRLERDRTHICEEHFLVRTREDLDGLFQRHPFHGLDIVHRLAPR